MPKQCNCTEESFGLPTIYPVGYEYCPNCGKRLEQVTDQELFEEKEVKTEDAK